MSESELLGARGTGRCRARGDPPGGYCTLYCGYLPLPVFPDTGYCGHSCIAYTTVLRYLSKGGIHAWIHGYVCLHATPPGPGWVDRTWWEHIGGVRDACGEALTRASHDPASFTIPVGKSESGGYETETTVDKP